MRVLFVNAVCGTGSTGRICGDLAKEYARQGHQVKIAYGRHSYVPEEYRPYAVQIGNPAWVKLHALLTRLTDRTGFFSATATRRFLRWAEEYDPDVLWLHNLHGYYIHIGLLFRWIKTRPQMQVKWTLHDCWAFTGHCPFFDFVGCSRWKDGCHHCPQTRCYPASYLMDSCRYNYEKKKALFTGVQNLTLITPSRWLGELTRQSFLKEYPLQIQPNTIDRAVFRPTPSDFRQRYRLDGCKLLLGVASTWERRKGLDDFLALSGLLDDAWRILLVGLTPEQAGAMPANVLCIPRTNSPRELAQIYTAADCFFNPTYEDNYPTVNLEAEACGTRVITYDTGGAKETIVRPDSILLPKGNWEALPDYL